MELGDNQVDGYLDGEEPLTFYHKKGEYRKYEAKEYQDLASGVSMPKRGLLRVLVSTKANRVMLFVMLITFAIVLAVRIFAMKSNEDVINGVFCDLSAFSIDDSVYASVKFRTSALEKEKVGKKGKVEPKDLHFVFAALDSDGTEIDTYEIDFLFEENDKNDKEEFVRASFVDYNVTKIKCTVSCQQEEPIELSSNIERH